jgi:fructoselysine-6-P-deglycase FrlB-like protein
MLFVAERQPAVNECRRLLDASGTAYVVGSGGSFPVALFVASALTRAGWFAQPVRPFDYIRLAGEASVVVVITYSGRTSDAGEVIDHAHAIGSRVVLLTSNARAPLKQKLTDEDTLIAYGAPDGPLERGFVSILGTVAPCALWVAASEGLEGLSVLAASLDGLVESDGRRADVVGGALRSDPSIALIGGGLAWPAIADLESKFVEARVADVQVHEAKDFSHGRFTSLLGSAEGLLKPTVVFGVGAEHPYEAVLRKVLRDQRGDETPSVSLRARGNSLTAALELLVRVQFFAQRAAAVAGVDISRPADIPEKGLALYLYEGKLAPAEPGQQVGSFDANDPESISQLRFR